MDREHFCDGSKGVCASHGCRNWNNPCSVMFGT